MYKFIKEIIVSMFGLIWKYRCAHRKYFRITSVIHPKKLYTCNHTFTIVSNSCSSVITGSQLQNQTSEGMDGDTSRKKHEVST
ncbi:MAG: hypothetical protein C4B59_06750 [Candidatus Methanogaster sp.]|uniref:Uncharacterized protein n=1 Tax=Candidatus Methanogaster sp. TaxID=3386292 RepID=A0AC61L369_9EURY|nr:MAG: hypothetical protein C4B59_06750 [ANME-2 cluster archaeon]